MRDNYMAMRDKTYTSLDGQSSHQWNKMCEKWKIECLFLPDVLVHLPQGLLSSSPNMDANQTAVKPDIVKILSIADSCTNATVG